MAGICTEKDKPCPNNDTKASTMNAGLSTGVSLDAEQICRERLASDRAEWRKIIADIGNPGAHPTVPPKPDVVAECQQIKSTNPAAYNEIVRTHAREIQKDLMQRRDEVEKMHK